MSRRMFLFALAMAMALAGCSAPVESGREQGAAGQQGDGVIAFSGKVVRVEIEGGFWGIVTDQGQKLDPRNLPENLQRDGLTVRGTLRPLKDMMSIRMWGTMVEIVQIEAAD